MMMEVSVIMIEETDSLLRRAEVLWQRMLVKADLSINRPKRAG